MFRAFETADIGQRDHKFRQHHSRASDNNRQFGNENKGSQRLCRRLHRVSNPANNPWIKRISPQRLESLFIMNRWRPEDITLYPLVQEHVETFFTQVENEIGPGLPDFVKAEFDAFLECGVLAHGFLRLRCSDCAHEKLVAF